MTESSPLPVESSVPVALVTGGSAGLGFHIAQALLRRGYHVVIAGRDEQRLSAAMGKLSDNTSATLSYQVADVGKSDDVSHLFAEITRRQGRLDVLVNCVGQSDRGLVEELTPDRLRNLFEQNVITALMCCQSAIPLLRVHQGVIVNIGSLAGKVSPRFLGGYSIAKHGLVAMSAQLRLELREQGVHVAVVNPGPIQRDDAGTRYDEQAGGLPNQARNPGAGARVSGLRPEYVAEQVCRCIESRKPDVLLPRYLRCLIAIGHTFPRLGDWLLLKFTSSP